MAPLQGIHWPLNDGGEHNRQQHQNEDELDLDQQITDDQDEEQGKRCQYGPPVAR